MIGSKIRRVTPGTPNSDVIRELTKNVNSLRNQRPSNDAYGAVQTPWGQSIIPGAKDYTWAYTTEGVPKATRNDDGSLLLGKGEASEAYLTIDEATGDLTMDYQNNIDNPFPVYNIASNSDGDVGAARWIGLLRIFDFWFVIWEECPDSAA